MTARETRAGRGGRWGAYLWAGLAALCSAALAAAAGMPALPHAAEPLDELVAALNAPDFQTRHAATTRLLESAELTLPMIESYLSAPGGAALTAEQRHRLLHAARHRFASGTRAAMGIKFVDPRFSPPPDLPDRILVHEAIAGFHCHTLLEPFDIITQAEGFPLRGDGGRELFRALIVSREPGDVIRLVVRRGEGSKTFDVVLGSYTDLREAAPLDEVNLARAWRVRSASYITAPEAAPLRCGLPVEVWAAHAQPEEQELVVRNRVKVPENASPCLVAGGRPRAGGDQSQAMRTVLTTGRLDPNAMRRLQAREAAQAWTLHPKPRMTTDQELMLLWEAKKEEEEKLATWTDNPHDKAQVREKFAINRRESETKLANLDKQIRAIEAEHREAAAEPVLDEGAVPTGGY